MTLRTWGWAAFYCLTAVSFATAQSAYRGGGNPRLSNYLNQKPVVSPYLNMFRLGDDASNYFNLVRPQVDQLRLNRQNDYNFGSLQRQISGMTSGQGSRQGTPPSTGHASVYGESSHFYGNHPARNGGGMRGSNPRRSAATMGGGGGMGYGGNMARSMLSRFGGGAAAAMLGSGGQGRKP